MGNGEGGECRMCHCRYHSVIQSVHCNQWNVIVYSIVVILRTATFNVLYKNSTFSPRILFKQHNQQLFPSYLTDSYKGDGVFLLFGTNQIVQCFRLNVAFTSLNA
jgi:hypothetical protein